ncbi:spore coat protein [Salmonella enterica subsp. enterica serovar Choleraesuis]|nr:spore coat protein [Salmonella enterica subsp. enterica serovar Choleraesuis]
MSVMRTFLLACLAVVGMMSFSPKAHAAHCWNLSPAQFNFDAITAGEVESSSNQLEFQCDNYDATAEYVRMCLSLTNSSQPVMNTNPANTPLYYNLYSADDPNTPIGSGNTTYAENTFSLAAGQANASFPMKLIAKLVPGQTTLQAGDYHDYNTSLTVKYAYSASSSALPSCQSMTGETMPDSIASEAVVKDGCALLNVDPMDFGDKTPADGSQLSGDARSSVQLHCPVNTNFTVSLGMGLHSDGSSRQMCNGNNCVTYGLYQDAAHSTPWNDSSNVVAQTSNGQSEQTIDVYGNIPPQSWPSPGHYEDTVVVTLNY